MSRPRPVGELADTRLGEAMRVAGDEVRLDLELGAALLYGDAPAARATRSVEWPCGHSPAATRPDVVADLIAERVAAVG